MQLDVLHSVHKRRSSPMPKRVLPSRSVDLQVSNLKRLLLTWRSVDRRAG